MEASGINILDIISKKPHSTLNCHKDLVKNSQDGSQRITRYFHGNLPRNINIRSIRSAGTAEAIGI